MRSKPLNPVRSLLLALVPMTAWAAWLGWDQLRDIHPDGSVTGPYEAWQVIGLVVTLLPAVGWAAFRRYVADAVVGTTAGLTAALGYDWSDDGSGLFVIGAGLAAAATLAATTALCALVVTLTPDRPRG
ncbi:hypothetical protein AB0K51_30075 [Kitasatospora sp. NPDC049285]|uniref:hypothetical protein n=1 Tax=Kitasatospora sp. NPDC049285 TaxID=3157096 RepID=UPI003417E995